VSLGSDAMTATSYHPFEHPHWYLTGHTMGGTPTLSEENLLSRQEALRGYTLGSAWFSFEETERGSLEPGKIADLVVLSGDYFTVPSSKSGICAAR
jgi:predicted amidohydrolase YtcJ